MPPDAPVSRGATLEEWISMHGPLWPAAALALALETGARASRLPEHELRRVIGSLNASAVTRRAHGGWSWMPIPVGSAKAQTVTDAEIVERIGAMMFHALAGQPPSDPFASEHALRARLRTLRPDLSAALVDLSVHAIAVRQRERPSLATFVHDVRQVLGIEHGSEHRDSRRRLTFAGSAVVALVVVSGLWWTLASGLEDRLGTHGLSRRETVQVDVTAEAAETFALIDEHTAAIQLYRYLGQVWRARVSPDDPRMAWNVAHEAWVRTLAGDRFTAEQLLVDMPDWLARALGDGHPYTRAVRLALADTLNARGAVAEAALLRDQAAKATHDLLRDAVEVPNEVPEPPGVIAHVASNRPEQEGFRAGTGGSFFAPMTSAGRWLAGRNGWRLHLVAEATCRATFVAGSVPRAVVAAASRAADGSWQIVIEGTAPALMLRRARTESIHVALAADATGTVQVRLGDQLVHRTVIDTTKALATPPYALAFDEAPAGRGCAVVWLEIPFPSHAK
jgi:hypothetical protein